MKHRGAGPRRRLTSLPAVIGALATSAALLAVLSACTPAAVSTPPASPSTSTSATASPTTAPSDSATPSTTASPASSTIAPAGSSPRCTVSTLRGSWHGEGGALGTFYGDLALTNVGSTTCALHGWPGVSLVAGSRGTQVGAAARETFGTRNQHPVTVTLRPGAGARAQIGIGTAQNYDARCELQHADGFRVYPPGSYDALFVRAAIDGCRNGSIKLLTVAPLRSGS